MRRLKKHPGEGEGGPSLPSLLAVPRDILSGVSEFSSSSVPKPQSRGSNMAAVTAPQRLEPPACSGLPTSNLEIYCSPNKDQSPEAALRASGLSTNRGRKTGALTHCLPVSRDRKEEIGSSSLPYRPPCDLSEE